MILYFIFPTIILHQDKKKQWTVQQTYTSQEEDNSNLIIDYLNIPISHA